jgi:hypothetical protein
MEAPSAASKGIDAAKPSSGRKKLSDVSPAAGGSRALSPGEMTILYVPAGTSMNEYAPFSSVKATSRAEELEIHPCAQDSS